MSDIDKMRAKLLEVADPNNPYTQEDFHVEFGGSNVGTLTIADKDYYKMKILFSNKSNNEDPTYTTTGASGLDLRANLDSPIVLKPRQRTIIPTGLFFNLPENFEIQIRPRSGLALKYGITVLNSPGTIDADYRGEIKVILINHGDDDFTINHGDRIAQAVIATVMATNIIKLVKVDDITSDTERGASGFGSTGKQ